VGRNQEGCCSATPGTHRRNTHNAAATVLQCITLRRVQLQTTNAVFSNHMCQLTMVDRKKAEWRRSESGHDGGWRLRLVAVANCGAADRSIGSDSARAAAPESLAGLPRFSDHEDVHRWQRPALWGRRRSGWAVAHSCASQWPGCGARPRLGFTARGRCGPSPDALQGRIYLNAVAQGEAPHLRRA